MTLEEVKQKIYNASKEDTSSPKNCIHLLCLHGFLVQIYNDHEIALKELKAENLAETEMFNKVMKAKDEEIKKLKSIISQVAFGE